MRQEYSSSRTWSCWFADVYEKSNELNFDNQQIKSGDCYNSRHSSFTGSWIAPSFAIQREAISSDILLLIFGSLQCTTRCKLARLFSNLVLCWCDELVTLCINSFQIGCFYEKVHEEFSFGPYKIALLFLSQSSLKNIAPLYMNSSKKEDSCQ